MADVPRNLDNTWFRKQNFVRLARQDVNKRFVLDSGVTKIEAAGKTVQSGARDIVSAIITAVQSPTLGTLIDGDQVQDGLSAGALDTANYQSSAFTPDDLFAASENGTWLTYRDPATLFQEVAGSTAVTAGDPVGLAQDQSPNSVNAEQSTSAARPVYSATPDKITLDKVDDNMSIDFGAAFTGTVFQGTPNGTLHYEIDVPSGVWSLTQNTSYVPDGGLITEVIAVEGVPTASKINNAKAYLQGKGAGEDFSGSTSLEQWFRGRTDITALYTDYYDTSSVTNFKRFIWDCQNLTSIDVSNWDTSSATDFTGFANGATGLNTVTVNGGSGNPFSDSACTSYNFAFTNTNLNQQSIDDILVAIEAAGTSTGTFNQSGGTAPSATGEAAIDALRGRGWTVSVTGGY